MLSVEHRTTAICIVLHSYIKKSILMLLCPSVLLIASLYICIYIYIYYGIILIYKSLEARCPAGPGGTDRARSEVGGGLVLPGFTEAPGVES